MKLTSSGFRWPLRVLPALIPHLVGTFPMVARDQSRTYFHATFALHLHDYAGDLGGAKALSARTWRDHLLATGNAHAL